MTLYGSLNSTEQQKRDCSDYMSLFVDTDFSAQNAVCKSSQSSRSLNIEEQGNWTCCLVLKTFYYIFK